MRFAPFTNAQETSSRERSADAIISRAQQQRCDAIQAEAREAKQSLFRAPAIAPLPPSDDILERRIAEEIEYARRLIETIGNTLVADSIVIARHQQCLQSFDIVGQMLGHLAAIIGTSDRRQAIARIGMEDLRSRLDRPLGSVF